MIELPPKHNESLVRAYVFEESLSGCELYNHLEGDSWDKQLKAWGYPSHESLDVEPHHIFGGGNRWDIVPNIIAISRPVHDWGHRKNPHALRVAAIWAKLRKGEFDRDLMRACLGFDPIGKIETYDLQEDWLLDLRMDVLEMC